MATDGVSRISGFVGKLVGRTQKSETGRSDFSDYMNDAYHYRTRPKQEREDSVDISRDASKLARYARELVEIRKEYMEQQGRGEFVKDGNPLYLEDTSRAYNVLRKLVAARLKKYPAALNADIEILNVVLERVLTEEARELAQSSDVNMFTEYITDGERMLCERLIGANMKYLKSFFYLLNVMEPEKAERSAAELMRKNRSPSLERLSYGDIARLKEFGRHNRSLSLVAKWNMLSQDNALSEVLRGHFAMLYRHAREEKAANKAAEEPEAYFTQDFFFSG